MRCSCESLVAVVVLDIGLGFLFWLLLSCFFSTLGVRGLFLVGDGEEDLESWFGVKEGGVDGGVVDDGGFVTDWDLDMIAEVAVVAVVGASDL